MDSNRLLEIYVEYTTRWMTKQVNLNNYIDRWLNSDVKTTAQEMQKLLDDTYVEIDKLKIAASKILLEYHRVKNEEIKKANPLRIVNSSFTMAPEGQELKDISPVNTYLIGKPKTVEEKGKLRQEQLMNLRIKIVKKEIDFIEAEKLLKVINNTYGTTNEDLLEELKRLSL